LDQTEPILVPFLKWAGGKRWLAHGHKHLFPSTFKTYVEPFLGGGAVFFYLSPKNAILSDTNSELIHVYETIKSDWQKVNNALMRHQRNHSEIYYYAERDRIRRAPHERAAQLIYLNRTCWNGLYRVNRHGKFNVPIGTKTSVLLSTDDFALASKTLSNAELIASDFEPVIDSVGVDDFIFIDPPYVTRHNFNGFRKYNETIFTWEDQVRLAEAVARAAERGALILLTNADHPCLRELYQGLCSDLKISSLSRSSVLAADASQRGLITEMAVTINYEPHCG
jgi:DNA adenine methylase